MLLRLANKLEATGQTVRLAKLGSYSESELRKYLDIAPVIFAYRLASNDENKRRGRVGRSSGFRQGVRNPEFIPAGKQARTKSNSTRYYDLTKQAWRMWKPGNVVSVTAFWSVFEGAFVDSPEAAGLAGQKPFGVVPMSEPVYDAARADRSAARDAATRREQIARTATREATRKAREATRTTRALRR